MSKKILFVASVELHIRSFHLPYLKMFKRAGWEVHVAAKSQPDLYKDRMPYCDVYHDISIARKPWHLDNYNAYKKIRILLKKEKYDIVHCHTPVASVLTRMAGRDLLDTRMIYTAHGFHFFRGASLCNWLIFWPVEYICARWTDDLIVINREDYQRAKKFKLRSNDRSRVYYIPGVGLDVEKFGSFLSKDKKELIRDELEIPINAVMLLSVGELSKRKNHKIIILAMSRLKKENPDLCKKIYYFIAGTGVMKKSLEVLIEKCGLEQQIKLLGYRMDVPDLVRAADIFAFPSYQEGLPVALMEAMASGLPCLASRIRGNTDLIDTCGGRLFEPGEIRDCTDKLRQMVSASADELEVFRRHNRQVIKQYDLKIVEEKMREVYAEV